MKKSKKILAVHRYYWPDTPPYASMLRCIVRHWVEEGHNVDVLSSQPSYKKGVENDTFSKSANLDGATVHRYELPNETGRPFLRLFNTLRFLLLIIYQALKGRYDVIMVSTAPPVVPGFAANIASRLTGAKLIYHCMDLHPEIGKLSGEFSNPTVYRALERIDIATCRRASRIIVLSEDMRKAIGKRDASLVSKVSVINNFSLPSEDKLSNSKSDWFEVKSKDKLRLFFAGNIGRFQGLELFVEAIHELVQSGNTHVELVFMGEGAALPEITKLANSGPAKDLIHFVSHQPISIAKRAMQAADFGIVCLTPEIIRYAYPSKTLTYLEQGCPIFSVVEQDSELAKMVETRQIGVSSPINDKAALVYRLTELANNREKCLTFSENAKATYKELFEIETCLEKWSHELKEL